MMNEIEEGTEVSHTAFSGLDKQRYNEDYAEQSPQDENESINDNEATYATIGYSYITSNIKWFLIAIGSFAAFFGLGWGSGYGIGDAIFYFRGGDNNESSVSSAMAADFTTSDNNGGKSGKGEGGAKSGKSTSSKSGKSLKECVDFTVDILTDNFPEETSWKLLNMCTGEEQLSEDLGTESIEPFSRITSIYCVPDSRYTFIIEDISPNNSRDATGLDCSSETDCTGTDGPGNYTVTLKGAESASGGGKFNTQIPAFKSVKPRSKEATTFGIPFDDPTCQSPCRVATPINIGSTTQGTTIGVAPIISVKEVAPTCSSFFDGPVPVTAPTGAFYQVTGNGQKLVASTCGTDFNTKISVYNSCDFSQVDICEAGNDGGGICSSQVVWPTTDSQDYYILVHGFIDQTGNFELSVDEVDDDNQSDCTNAATLALDTPVSGTTFEGPTVTGGFSCPYINLNSPSFTLEVLIFPGVNVAWYKVIGTGSKLSATLAYSLNAFGGADPQIVLFNSCGGIASSCVAGSFSQSFNLPAGTGSFSIIWQSVSGDQYYLMVNGELGKVGEFDLSLTEVLP